MNMSQYLSEAFKKLDTLNEETFSVTDSGLQDFVKFTEDDEDENIIDIIDVEAETVEDLEDSYIGKVILDCCVCHSKLYKDTEDVVIEDDLANVNEECPFCYANDGYKVVGQVATFGEAEEEEKDEEEIETNVKNESYKDTHMIMGGDGSEVYTDEDLRKIWNNSHTTDPSMKEYKSFDDWKSDTISQMEEINESKSIKEEYVEATPNDKDCFAFITTINKRTRETKRQRVEGSYGKIRGIIASKQRNETLYDFEGPFKNESKSIKEDINNLSLDTDDTHMEMTSDENGKVTISTEPLNNAKVDENETIAPIEPETQNEIESNVADGEEIEIDVDEFDEESFDELGEGYLKKVYENVNSFKTSRVSFLKDKLILEGVIKFNSGNSKKTNFIFGIREATKSGKVRFIGENREIARGKKSFTITGRIDNKRFLSESFNYNYGVKTPLGKVKRLYGTINK
jgi:hypothetical protein